MLMSSSILYAVSKLHLASNVIRLRRDSAFKPNRCASGGTLNAIYNFETAYVLVQLWPALTKDWIDNNEPYCHWQKITF